MTRHERLLRQAAANVRAMTDLHRIPDNANEVIGAVERAIDNHRYQNAALKNHWCAKEARYMTSGPQPKCRLPRVK